ncbi:MAG: hypothetical protein HZC40_02200 [Chloroflexi bacterium]|nr:hypothetical protein [Chloroflexota bacterium]
MPFTVNDVQDLTRVLTLHPEWLAEVRRLVLTAELLALPDLIRELVEAQTRSEARLDRLEAAVVELVEAQTRSEARLDRFEKRLDQIDGRLGNLVGRDLEHKYRDNVAAYFGTWLWPARAVDSSELRDDLEQRLDRTQTNDVLLLDLIVRGTARRLPDKPEIWLAIEVSAVIDRADVARVLKRAALLRQAGYRAVPVVAGDALTLGAEEELGSAPIIVLRDGQSQGWEAALASA